MGTLITVALTVISGVAVFIVGEYIKEIWLTPLQDYKRIKNKISYSLTYYAQYYCNPVELDNMTEEYKSASKELRIIAAEARAFIETLGWLRFGIPSKKTVYDASALLIGISNGLSKPHLGDGYPIIELNEDHKKEIYRLLKIYKSRE